MRLSFSLGCRSDIIAALAKSCTGPNKLFPGATLHIVDRDGNVLLHEGAGEVVSEAGRRPYASNDLHAFASCIKLIIAVAVMQMVDRGLLDLDDPEIVSKILPEISNRKVLLGFANSESLQDPIWKEPVNPITVRMLLTHTSGFGHMLFHPMTSAYIGHDPLESEIVNMETILRRSPLIAEPGSEFNYGVSTDFCGFIIERLTNRNLQDYIVNEICVPTGMKDTFFSHHLQPSDYGRIVPWKFRTEDGEFVDVPRRERLEIAAEDRFPVGTKHAYSAGGGMIGSVEDFGRLMATILNDGVSPLTGHRLLSSASVKEIFRGQTPDGMEFRLGSNGPGSIPVDLKESYRNPKMSFTAGLGHCGLDKKFNSGNIGRRAGSIFWSGFANLDFWIDPVTGIGVAFWGSILPFRDIQWVEFGNNIEEMIYNSLKEDRDPHSNVGDSTSQRDV